MGRGENFSKMGKDVLKDIETEEDDKPMKNPKSEPKASEKPQDLSSREDATEEAIEAAFEEKVAKMAQVLSRGILNDRLTKILKDATPDDRTGKFVRDTEGDIARYRNLGFDFTYREGHQVKGTHGTGDSRIRVGDVVLMTISEENSHVLREVRRRLVKKKLGAAREEYLSRVANDPDAAPAFDNSQQTIG